jgi:hypothetical protein
MATGDQADIVNRLQRLIPQGWFAQGATPLRDALLAGVANAFSFLYSALAYVRLQTRIATATDGYLDMIAADYFGGNLLRYDGQTDTSLRANILANIVRSRGTRDAVIAILKQLTGQTPLVFEPTNVHDAGAYNVGTAAYGVGAYGSLNTPYDSFVTAFTGGGVGIPNVAGYGISTGGYSQPSEAAYEDPGQNALTYADIYNAINSVRPIGYTIYVKIIPGPATAWMAAAKSALAGSQSEDGTSWTFDSGVVTFDSGTYTMDG